MAPKEVREQNFIDSSETLKFDDSTTFLMVFKCTKGCREQPKTQKIKVNGKLRSQIAKKDDQGDNKVADSDYTDALRAEKNRNRPPGGASGRP